MTGVAQPDKRMEARRAYSMGYGQRMKTRIDHVPWPGGIYAALR